MGTDQGASPGFIFSFIFILSADERLIDQKHGVVQRTDVGTTSPFGFFLHHVLMGDDE